jgi:hypothetical protein
MGRAGASWEKGEAPKDLPLAGAARAKAKRDVFFS